MQQFLDSHPVSRRQRLIIFLLMMVMVFEGLDQIIAAQVFPQLIHEWGTSVSSITEIVTASSLSLAVGSVVAGPITDRFGRKPPLIVGILLFGAGTAAMGRLSQDVIVFGALRCVACIGLGITVVVTMALTADLLPTARRSQMMVLVFAGVTLGSLFGSLLAAVAIEPLGWRAVLGISGLLPLLLIRPITRLVPESPTILVARGRTDAVRSALQTLLPGSDASSVDLSLSESEEHLVRPTAILGRMYIARTLLIWLLFLAAYSVLTVLLQYTPMLLQAPVPGFTTAQSGLTMTVFSIGGLVGGLSVSFVLKRVSRFATLSTVLVLAAAVLFAIALVPTGFVTLMVGFLFLGLTFSSATSSLATVGGLAYPTALRGTGLGAANTAGRVGTLVGGLAGGTLITSGLNVSEISAILSAPVLASALCIVALRALT
ncbi:MFS transporter [Streptomyces carpinensis]|uniref:MFS transporter n=1 Tax=Streptomyces carpinensis TaxID=66369 RepID=A0ABV1VYH4_9ACTN|nr:MFS transporter [Streptomyces carpinensis]